MLQNIHRYTWYFTFIFAVLLTYDAIEAFRFPGGVGIGVGTLILVVERGVHLGLHARLSCLPPPERREPQEVLHRPGAAVDLDRTSRQPLNKHHQLFAWLSLMADRLVGLYIYLVSSGTFSDPRIF